jgi:hypothetical protein
VRFDRETVKRVAEIAKEFTGGKFAMSGIGMDQGNGVRYADAHTMRMWFGPEGARSACAYYIGATLGYARATATHIKADDVKFLKSVQDAYAIGSEPRRAKYRKWEEIGYQEGQQKA